MVIICLREAFQNEKGPLNFAKKNMSMEVKWIGSFLAKIIDDEFHLQGFYTHITV